MIRADITAGWMAWTDRMDYALPMGSILCGTHTCRMTGTQALLWLPTGWWAGNGGVCTHLADQQTSWLRAVRYERALSTTAASKAVMRSSRTWEGWENGRRKIGAAAVLAIYHEILAPGSQKLE